MSKIIGVIPARMNASRFPGKPLASLHGRPMIEHDVKRSEMAPQLAAVYVATCDREIKMAVESFGGKVIMTSSAHERASERTAEAAAHFEAGVIVMIQGDEPMITPEMISAAVAPLAADPAIDCVNLISKIESREEYEDFNTIKVIVDSGGDAVSFSRTPAEVIDFSDVSHSAVYKQVCIIPFRRSSLLEFAGLAPTPLERAESIDMLRFLEHGRKVRLVETPVRTHAVDTPEDLRLVETLMQNDALRLRY